MRQRIRVLEFLSAAQPQGGDNSAAWSWAHTAAFHRSRSSAPHYGLVCVARLVMHSASLVNLISKCSSLLVGFSSGSVAGIGRVEAGLCAQKAVGLGLTAAAEMPTPARNDIPLLGKQLKDRLSLQVFYPWPHSSPPGGLSSIRHYSSKNPL